MFEKRSIGSGRQENYVDS